MWLLVLDRFFRGRRTADNSRYRLLRFSDDEVRAIHIERTWESRKKTVIQTIMVAMILATATVLAFSVCVVN